MSTRPNRRAQRQARRAERERNEILVELRARREQLNAIMRVAIEMHAPEIVRGAAEQLSRVEQAIAGLQDKYAGWTREHLST